MHFANRPPIGLEDAEVLAQVEQDGGCWPGVGYDRYTVYQGKRVHLVHAYSDGADDGHGATGTSNHLGFWYPRRKLSTWLSKQTHYGKLTWWAAELLELIAREDT